MMVAGFPMEPSPRADPGRIAPATHGVAGGAIGGPAELPKGGGALTTVHRKQASETWACAAARASKSGRRNWLEGRSPVCLTAGCDAGSAGAVETAMAGAGA